MKEILLTEKKMVFLVLLYFYGPIQLDCIFMLNFILFFKFWLLNSTLWNFCFKKGTISRAAFRTLSILKIVVPWYSAYHYCTSSFNKVWTEALRRFKSCLGRVGDSRWWGSLTMVPTGNKAEHFSSVNHTTKTIHRQFITEDYLIKKITKKIFPDIKHDDFNFTPVSLKRRTSWGRKTIVPWAY